MKPTRMRKKLFLLHQLRTTQEGQLVFFACEDGTPLPMRVKNGKYEAEATTIKKFTKDTDKQFTERYFKCVQLDDIINPK